MANTVATAEESDRPGGVLDVDAQLVEDISALIETKQHAMLLNVVADLYPADLAALIEHLPFERAYTLFHWLPVEDAGEVLAELDSEAAAALLEESSHERVTAIIDELDTDDAADVLAELSDELTLRVLPQLEDAADLQELLGYAEDTAGGIMGTEFVAVRLDGSVAEATEEVRRNAETVEEVFAVFVVDDGGHLRGVVSLKRLLLSPADARVDAIMDADVIAVRVDVDQEEVGRIMQRYDLITLPVVDPMDRLVGRITIDDVVDVIREEAEEDIQRMSGVSGDERPSDSVFRVSRGRLPWLFIGLAGAGLSGLVINSFEGALEQAVVLAMFIPVVMATGGNAGIQSSAIVVKGLASGEVWSSDLMRRLTKELAVALLNGLALGLALSLFVIAFASDAEPIRLALTAGLSLLIVVLLATIIGTGVPLILHRLGVDPALATGPFITTSNDLIGLTVFFVLATLLYL